MTETPCIGICKVDYNKGTCIGCGRTISEISNWIKLSELEKKEIMLRLKKDQKKSDDK